MQKKNYLKQAGIIYSFIFLIINLINTINSYCKVISKVNLNNGVLLIVVIVKMQNICNLNGWNSVHMSDIFNYYRANINGMWNTRKLGGTYITFEFRLTQTCMRSYRVNQHLIVLNVDSASINKILAMEFITVKVSQNLNLM